MNPFRKKTGQLSGRGWVVGLGELENRVFTPRNLRFYVPGIVFANIVGLAQLLIRGLVLPSGRYACIDFGWIWLSGKFAAAGRPGDVFDYSKFAAAQSDFFGSNNCVLLHHFDYPPTILLFNYPLGLMSFGTAFFAWNFVLLLLYLTAVYTIVPRTVTVLLALTPFSLLADLEVGQNGLLTAALIAFSLAFAERRPLLSGIALGLLTYKPQFGLLFPFALIASRNWRAFGWAVAATTTVTAAAAIFVGLGAWPAFIATLSGRSSTLSPEPGVVLFLQSVYGLFQWTGLSSRAAWIAQLLSAFSVTLAVIVAWSKPIPFPLKAALLCVATLLATPYLLPYDLCILTVAAVFLVKDGISRGFLPGERIALVVCWAGGSGLFSPTPISPFFCLTFLFLIGRRLTLTPTVDPASVDRPLVSRRP